MSAPFESLGALHGLGAACGGKGCGWLASGERCLSLSKVAVAAAHFVELEV